MTHHYSIAEQPANESDARTAVVLAMTESWPAVEARVATLLPHCRRTGARLVVACTAAPAQLVTARLRWTGAEFVAAPSGTGLAALRTLGIHEADADIVTVVDSRSVAGDRARRPVPELRLESVS